MPDLSHPVSKPIVFTVFLLCFMDQNLGVSPICLSNLKNPSGNLVELTLKHISKTQTLCLTLEKCCPYESLSSTAWITEIVSKQFHWPHCLSAQS